VCVCLPAVSGSLQRLRHPNRNTCLQAARSALSARAVRLPGSGVCPRQQDHAPSIHVAHTREACISAKSAAIAQPLPHPTQHPTQAPAQCSCLPTHPPAPQRRSKRSLSELESPGLGSGKGRGSSPETTPLSRASARAGSGARRWGVRACQHLSATRA